MSQNPILTKRMREKAKREKKMRKAEKKAWRAAERDTTPNPDMIDGEDPDIAGIIPGPQPPIWETEPV